GLAALVAGCGGDGTRPGDRPRLTVSAATSLTTAFESYGPRFAPASVRFNFAGSDELAAQIRQGVKPDLYAAANTKLPDQLCEEGLVEEPVRFAGNRLVIAVPAGSQEISGLADLGRDGLQLAIGAEGVPAGDYAREVVGRLPPARRRAVLANVRSEEPDVGGVVGKLTQGAADAGFLYVNDVRAAAGQVRKIELPRGLQPSVEYGVAVVKGAKEAPAAREFVEDLLDGVGREAMRDAGFEPPPGR
nr:molybdate ABC transporter substrate-binding protein [Thermoleophilaceae bacterium]